MDVEIKHGYSFDVEMTLVPNGIVNTQLTFEFRGWQGVAGGGRWGGGVGTSQRRKHLRTKVT